MSEIGRSQQPGSTPEVDVYSESFAPGPPGYPSVAVREEGMREGMQIEDASISVDDKVRLLDALSKTGLRRIVVGSFVSPKWTPQMAQIDEVVNRFEPVGGIAYSALALNARGVERRAALTPPLSPSDEPARTFAHLCDVFAQRNTNRTQVQEIASWSATISAALESGHREATVGIGAAWGSNWLGRFAHDARMDLISSQIEAWGAAGIEVTRVRMADPMGWNLPHLVAEDLAAISERWPGINTFDLHLHNTRGTVAASIYAALQALDSRHRLILDSSIGGMAGCPYGGNGRAASLFPTEDLIYLLEGLGFETGVDLDSLIEAVILAEEVVGHRLFGHVSKAGGPPTGSALYPMDLPFIETLDEAQHFRIGPSAYEGCMSPWKVQIVSEARQT